MDANIRIKERIACAVGSPSFDPAGKGTLERVARAWLQASDLPPLTVVGAATDAERALPAQRRQLAAARARAARDALVAAGMPDTGVTLRSAEEYAEWHRTTVGGGGTPDALDFSGVVVELFRPRPSPTSCGRCTLLLTGTLIPLDPDPQSTDVLRVCSEQGCASIRLDWPGRCLPQVAYAGLSDWGAALRLELRPDRWRIWVSGLPVSSAPVHYHVELLRNGRAARALSAHFAADSWAPLEGCPTLPLDAFTGVSDAAAQDRFR